MRCALSFGTFSDSSCRACRSSSLSLATSRACCSVKKMSRAVDRCFVDESVHDASGFVVTAFVFADATLEERVSRILIRAGLVPGTDELKSSSRMDSDPRMQAARDHVLTLANTTTKVAVFVGPYNRASIGKDCLQALQSVLVRNGLSAVPLDVYFDEGIFVSTSDAQRLQPYFRALTSVQIHHSENSRLVLGIQVADVLAHSFAQIVKAQLTGRDKEVDIGGPKTGYPEGTKAPLAWSLLMNLRYALFTRPIASAQKDYRVETDPVVLDPLHDDQVTYGQNPVLLGWGIQVAPEAGAELRVAVEKAFGRIWLGCIH